MYKSTFSVDYIFNVYDYVRNNMNHKMQLKHKDISIGSSFKFMFENKDKLKCDVCGIEASHFVVVKNGKENNLRLICSDNVRHMTVDHTLARALGGNNKKENKVVLCNHCNSHWKSHIESSFKKKLVGLSVDKKYFLVQI